MMNTDKRRVADVLCDQLPPEGVRRFEIRGSEDHIRLHFDDNVTVPGVPGQSDLWDYVEASGLRVTGLNFESKTVTLES